MSISVRDLTGPTVTYNATDVRRADSVYAWCWWRRADGIQDVLWIRTGLPLSGSVTVFEGGQDMRQEKPDSEYVGQKIVELVAQNKQGRVIAPVTSLEF